MSILAIVVRYEHTRTLDSGLEKEKKKRLMKSRLLLVGEQKEGIYIYEETRVLSWPQQPRRLSDRSHSNQRYPPIIDAQSSLSRFPTKTEHEQRALQTARDEVLHVVYIQH